MRKALFAIALAVLASSLSACSETTKTGEPAEKTVVLEKTVVREVTRTEKAQKPEKEAPTKKVVVKRQQPKEPEISYERVSDDTGAVSAEVPETWGGRITNEAWPFEGEVVGPSVTASSDLDAWHNTGGVPGTFVLASKVLAQRGYTDDQLLDSAPYDLSSACTPVERRDFERGDYTGRIQHWKDCYGQAGSEFYTVSAGPTSRECVVLVQVAMLSEEDRRAAHHVLDTFEANCAIADPPVAVSQPAQAPEAVPQPAPEVRTCKEVYGAEFCNQPIQGDGYNDDGSWHGPCPEGQVALGEGCADPNADPAPAPESDGISSEQWRADQLEHARQNGSLPPDYDVCSDSAYVQTYPENC